jgi:hypothetical protein
MKVRLITVVIVAWIVPAAVCESIALAAPNVSVDAQISAVRAAQGFWGVPSGDGRNVGVIIGTGERVLISTIDDSFPVGSGPYVYLSQFFTSYDGNGNCTNVSRQYFGRKTGVSSIDVLLRSASIDDDITVRGTEDRYFYPACGDDGVHTSSSLGMYRVHVTAAVTRSGPLVPYAGVLKYVSPGCSSGSRGVALVTSPGPTLFGNASATGSVTGAVPPLGGADLSQLGSPYIANVLLGADAIASLMVAC